MIPNNQESHARASGTYSRVFVLCSFWHRQALHTETLFTDLEIWKEPMRLEFERKIPTFAVFLSPSSFIVCQTVLGLLLEQNQRRLHQEESRRSEVVTYAKCNTDPIFNAHLPHICRRRAKFASGFHLGLQKDVESPSMSSAYGMSRGMLLLARQLSQENH